MRDPGDSSVVHVHRFVYDHVQTRARQAPKVTFHIIRLREAIDEFVSLRTVRVKAP
jgi:hypothetical protein